MIYAGEGDKDKVLWISLADLELASPFRVNIPLFIWRQLLIIIRRRFVVKSKELNKLFFVSDNLD